MAEIKLFSYSDSVVELPAKSVDFEKELQTLIETNMESFFGVRFLKSEFTIANGRIDSLGLDENNCPVIFEYKRSSNENVINQGLFYLDWLLDHKADFFKLVMETVDLTTANNIDWSVPSVICIANDFTKYDEHAVNQMQKNIKLVRYRKYENRLILFEFLNAPKVKALKDNKEIILSKQNKSEKPFSDKTFEERLQVLPQQIATLYSSISSFILSLGDDITENQLKFYVAFKKIRNIICVEIFKNRIIMHLSINPKTVKLEKNFTRDMTEINHYGTGDLEIVIKNMEDFEKAKPLIEKAYNIN